MHTGGQHSRGQPGAAGAPDSQVWRMLGDLAGFSLRAASPALPWHPLDVVILPLILSGSGLAW